MEILSEARTLGGGGGLVFPSPEGRAFSAGTLPTLLRRLGIADRTRWGVRSAALVLHTPVPTSAGAS